MVKQQEHGCKIELPLSSNDIATAIEKIVLIRTDIRAGINCWNRMVRQHRLNDEDFRRALRKYVEDVGESVKVLDCRTGHGLLDALIEFEEWKGLKGVRDIIAHQPGKVDDDVVFEAVVNDFPTLSGLFDLLFVYNRVLNGDETWELPVGENQGVQRTSAFSLHKFREYRYTLAAAYCRDEGWLVERIVVYNYQGEIVRPEFYYNDSNPDGTRMRVRGRVPSLVSYSLSQGEIDELDRRRQESKA